MATIGQQLLKPESGWKRYDDTDSNISYINNQHGNGSDYWNSSYMMINKGGYARFNFTGNKLRIISYCSASQSVLKLYIDGKDMGNFDAYINSSNIVKVLVFDIQTLSNKEHYMELKYEGSRNMITLDAIDIDENGELRPYNSNVYKYLIQDKNNILYTLNENDLAQAPSQILDENNFINNGFTDTDLVSKDLLLSKFESLEEIKLLVYTDDLEKDKCEMIYNSEPFRPIDKLKKNSDICNILFKEV
ncbi:cell adhesion protein [Clostridium sporogenes]|uniref:cell adhesion protein n=1 Tax=Clostridium sporogenes TaxID=1509 RepID=UPI0013CF6AD0|nr:cell adhesion protein [Clostridium sporogenes]NFH40645.1 cell adhesion protein [Clostridium sporogenes]